MTGSLIALVACGMAGGVAGLLTPVLLRRLPEPRLSEPPAAEASSGTEPERAPAKTTYVELANWRPLPVVGGLSGALLAGSVGARAGDNPVVPALVYLCAVGVVLTYVDVRVHLLPNRIVLPSYGVVATLLMGAAVMTGDAAPLITAVIGGAVLWGAFFLLMVVYPAGMGFGDVKLAGLLGMPLGWLGLGEVLLAVFVAFLLGGLSGLTLIVTRRANRKSAVPFGPFLLAGFWVSAIVGHDVVQWYLTGGVS